MHWLPCADEDSCSPDQKLWLHGKVRSSVRESPGCAYTSNVSSKRYSWGPNKQSIIFRCCMVLLRSLLHDFLPSAFSPGFCFSTSWWHGHDLGTWSFRWKQQACQGSARRCEADSWPTRCACFRLRKPNCFASITVYLCIRCKHAMYISIPTYHTKHIISHHVLSYPIISYHIISHQIVYKALYE